MPRLGFSNNSGLAVGLLQNNTRSPWSKRQTSKGGTTAVVNLGIKHRRVHRLRIGQTNITGSRVVFEPEVSVIQWRTCGSKECATFVNRSRLVRAYTFIVNKSGTFDHDVHSGLVYLSIAMHLIPNWSKINCSDGGKIPKSFDIGQFG